MTAGGRLPQHAGVPVRLTRVNQRRLTILLAYTLTGRATGGGDLWRLAGGFAGRSHKFLWQMTAAGWAAAEREAPAPANRPARRLYRLTPEGIAGARTALELGVTP